MKTKNAHFINKLLLFLLLPFLAQAQYTKTFSDAREALPALTIEHNRGDLTIERSRDNQVRYDMVITFDARSDEEAGKLFDAFQVEFATRGGSLALTTTSAIKNVVTRNNRSTITLKNGTKIKGIKNLKVDMTVYTPELDDLALNHKYNDVRIAPGIAQNLEATLRSCEIDIGDVSGKLELEAKYVEGSLGRAGDAALDLYDCDLAFGDLGNTQLSSKYSELDFQRLASLNMNIYDDDIEAELVDGALTITDKYSEIEIGQCGNARLDLYDSQIEIRQGGNVQAKSKYTEFELGKMYVLDFQLSYDDNLQVDYATSLQVESSKYTSYEIGELSRRLEIQSYDDEIQVDRVSDQFEALTFEGKYTNMELDLAGGAAFRLRVDTKYGDLEVDEDAFDFQIWKEKNDVLEAEGRSKRANDNSPLFTIKGYDNNIRLK